MNAEEITVQNCGCLSLSDELSTALGILPGAVLIAEPNEEQGTLILRVKTPSIATLDVRTACSLSD